MLAFKLSSQREPRPLKFLSSKQARPQAAWWPLSRSDELPLPIALLAQDSRAALNSWGVWHVTHLRVAHGDVPATCTYSLCGNVLNQRYKICKSAFLSSYLPLRQPFPTPGIKVSPWWRSGETPCSATAVSNLSQSSWCPSAGPALLYLWVLPHVKSRLHVAAPVKLPRKTMIISVESCSSVPETAVPRSLVLKTSNKK